MTSHPSADATLLELADEGAPAARVCGYLNDSRPRKDVSESDILWCLRQATHLQVVVDGVEEIRADVDEAGEVRYPVVDETGERVFPAREVRALLAGESFTVTHVAESRFDDGLRADGGGDASGTARDGQVRWYYDINHSQSFETRHEAVGEAAIINRGRDDRRRDVAAWARPECDCDESVVTLDHGHACGRCGAVIA